jgi:hypothetical protein
VALGDMNGRLTRWPGAGTAAVLLAVSGRLVHVQYDRARQMRFQVAKLVKGPQRDVAVAGRQREGAPPSRSSCVLYGMHGCASPSPYPCVVISLRRLARSQYDRSHLSAHAGLARDTTLVPIPSADGPQQDPMTFPYGCGSSASRRRRQATPSPPPRPSWRQSWRHEKVPPAAHRGATAATMTTWAPAATSSDCPVPRVLSAEVPSAGPPPTAPAP